MAAKSTNEKNGAPDKEATIEQMLDEVDKIIAQLDSGEIPLEESFEIYEKGMKLVKSINTRIDKVEKKVMAIEAGQDGDEFPEMIPEYNANDAIRIPDSVEEPDFLPFN